LRRRRDRDALRKALAKGVLAAVCSDHQPQDPDAKKLPFDATEPGISALESWLPLILRLVDEGVLTLPQAIASLTSHPAEILGVSAGALTPGAGADICIFDPDALWTLSEDNMLSSGTNTPFLGESLKGKVRCTLYGGRIVYEDMPKV
jgi:dihydroorotase